MALLVRWLPLMPVAAGAPTAFRHRFTLRQTRRTVPIMFPIEFDTPRLTAQGGQRLPNYTFNRLEPTFRPHDQKRKDPEQIHADAKSFFGKANKGLIQDPLRRDAWKWENCLHGAVSFLGKSLRNPVFDIHYNVRLGGRDHAPDEELPYALVVSVQAKHLANLYDIIVRKYANVIAPLKPVVEIPVTI